MIAVPFEIWVGIGICFGTLFFFFLWYRDMKTDNNKGPLFKYIYPADKMTKCNICGAVFKKTESKRCPTCGSYN